MLENHNFLKIIIQLTFFIFLVNAIGYITLILYTEIFWKKAALCLVDKNTVRIRIRQTK
jgi:hypothetical protein